MGWYAPNMASVLMALLTSQVLSHTQRSLLGAHEAAHSQLRQPIARPSSSTPSPACCTKGQLMARCQHQSLYPTPTLQNHLVSRPSQAHLCTLLWGFGSCPCLAVLCLAPPGPLLLLLLLLLSVPCLLVLVTINFLVAPLGAGLARGGLAAGSGGLQGRKRVRPRWWEVSASTAPPSTLPHAPPLALSTLQPHLPSLCFPAHRHLALCRPQSL